MRTWQQRLSRPADAFTPFRGMCYMLGCTWLRDMLMDRLLGTGGLHHTYNVWALHRRRLPNRTATATADAIRDATALFWYHAAGLHIASTALLLLAPRTTLNEV